jgi:hypothetical protein
MVQHSFLDVSKDGISALKEPNQIKSDSSDKTDKQDNDNKINDLNKVNVSLAQLTTTIQKASEQALAA